MNDRELVITHLDDLRLFADITVHPVVSPDNWSVYSSLCDYIDQIKTDVAMLLKEQDAVKPTVSGAEEHDGLRSLWYQCGKCKMPIDYGDRFCRRCGRKVKWE